MAFSLSSKNIHLDRHFLKAECKDLDGIYWPSKINLNSCIVNHDGKLEWSPGGNFGSCSCGLRLEGTRLIASCKKIYGEEVTGSIDLDEHITNTDACLMFQRPRPGGFSATSHDIHIAGTQLRAFCKDKYGHNRYSTFELGDFIGNINGCLEWVDTGFGDTKGVHLIGTRLHAQAKADDGRYYCTAINLDEHVVNINGTLQMHMDKVLMKVTNENMHDVTRALDDYYQRKGTYEIETQLAEEGDLKFLYISHAFDKGTDSGILLQFGYEQQASLFSIVQKHGGSSSVSVSVMQARIQAWGGFGAGVAAHINLVNASAGPLTFAYSVGIDTGIGIKDDSLTATFLGTGFTLGRKIGISILNFSFEIDLGGCVIM